MSPHLFLTAFSIGTALLALWTHVRLPRLAPESFVLVILHLFLALIVLRVAAVPFALVDATPVHSFAMLMGLLTPALTYLFLAFLWLCVFLQGMLPGGRGQTQ